MVESTQNVSQTTDAHGILKNATEASQKAQGVHFDEQELFEYDKTRGQCQKIDDPKTPYHEEDDEEMLANTDG